MRTRTYTLIMSLLLSWLTLFSCSSKADASTQTEGETGGVNAKSRTATAFDVDSAMSYIKKQVDFGPRVPTSRAHAECADWLAAKLRSFGALVDDETVKVYNPDTKTAVPARNIFARFNPEAKERVIVLAHYDTRPWADEDSDPANHRKPIDGANDGASGVAVALELARHASAYLGKDKGLDILFVDQEDSGSSGNDDSWCLGSAYWATRQAPYTTENTPSFGILLDMVGGKDAEFRREYFSEVYASWVNDLVWQKAEKSGYGGRFVDEIGGAINDDHLSLLKAGIPTVDIIETRVGGFNPTWHTLEDNFDNIDPNTVETVGNVMFNVIYSKKMTIEEKQSQIIEEFSEIEDWMDRYAYIIDLGNSLPAIDESLKTPDHVIEGCQSRVWLDARTDSEGKVHFTADSDAIIVKGIISLLISVLNDHTPDEILSADLHFINDIGLAENLSPTRSNGLLAMIKQMRAYALAFKSLNAGN